MEELCHQYYVGTVYLSLTSILTVLSIYSLEQGFMLHFTLGLLYDYYLFTAATVCTVPLYVHLKRYIWTNFVCFLSIFSTITSNSSKSTGNNDFKQIQISVFSWHCKNVASFLLYF